MADRTNLEPKTAGPRCIGLEQSRDVGIGGVDVGPTERAGLIGTEPSVNALSVEGMAAEGEQPQLIVRLEL